MSEMKPVWRRACGASGQCVEVSSWLLPWFEGVAVRDSKHPTAHLKLTPGQFGRLLHHLKGA